MVVSVYRKENIVGNDKLEELMIKTSRINVMVYTVVFSSHSFLQLYLKDYYLIQCFAFPECVTVFAIPKQYLSLNWMLFPVFLFLCNTRCHS